MPLLFIFVIGIAVALVRRRLITIPGDQTYTQDAPARLLGWAIGLLAAQREQWGQAMIGELDRLDGRARRWRFAVGCVVAAVVMPPWGRTLAILGAMMAVAASAAGLFFYIHVHYRLGTHVSTWAGAAILVLILVGYILGGGVLLRRPGVAVPGLAGGLLLAAAWLAVGGFSFDRWLNSLGRSNWWLLILAPIVVGAGAALWGGNAAIGRRAARLASVTAALSIYLYGVLAVAVVGAAGHDPSHGWTPAQVVDDNLSNQAVFYLMALPLMAATIGWAAAAATARLSPARMPTTTMGLASAPTGAPLATRPESLRVSEEHLARPRRHRTWYVLLLCAALTAAAILVFLTFLSTHGG